MNGDHTMEIQIILTACIVIFGIIPVHPDNQVDGQDSKNMFKNLFDSIANNDKENSQIYHHVLKQEVGREQQAFDAMKKEIRIARNKNSLNRRNSYKQSNTGENVVEMFKRQLFPDEHTVETRVRGKVVIFEYLFEYAPFVDLMKNGTEKSEAEIHICDLEHAEILQICRDAITASYLKTTKVELVEGAPPGPEKVYQFTVCSYWHRGQPPLRDSACTCPTDPLLYLSDRCNNNTIQAYISLREAYSKQMS